MLKYYHTRNIVKDRLGVVERKKKGEKKNKKRKKEGKEKKKWYNDKVRKSALTYFQKKSSKIVKECWGFVESI